uniref:NIDO domain-containing protein n=1 Tax=Neolamprologus brichardi TaxID=32507 RepID=A0A3Q4HAR4_NEOBR
TISAASDDGSSPLIVLQRAFLYFGQSYNQIYVNHNGHLTFDASWHSYTPQLFPMYGSRDIIAPFWTDLDNRGNGQIYYDQYTSGSVLQQATRDINQYFPGLNFNANWVFVATWYQIAYFPTSGTQTTVQAVLISGGQYSFVLMNYEQIAYTTYSIQPVRNMFYIYVCRILTIQAFSIFFHDLPNCFLGPLYPTSGTVSSAVDDGSSPKITLLRPFFYFGRTYNSIYVNHNGHLTFTGPLRDFTSQRFPQRIRDIIAPFWTDLDNRGNGQIYYNQYTSGSVLQQVIRLPFSAGSNGIQIFYSNLRSVIIRTSFGVTVQTVWPHFVRVTAPGVYSGSLGGLCGNYNGRPHDDFRTPNGVLVNSSQEFGDSWRDGSLAAHCVESRGHDPRTDFNSSEYCGILSSPDGPFVPCWSVVDPRQQVDVCVKIMRGSNNPASTLCDVLRDYALMCQQKGVALGQWRNATGCGKHSLVFEVILAMISKCLKMLFYVNLFVFLQH